MNSSTDNPIDAGHLPVNVMIDLIDEAMKIIEKGRGKRATVEQVKEFLLLVHNISATVFTISSLQEEASHPKNDEVRDELARQLRNERGTDEQ